jgi:hypothetical protein
MCVTARAAMITLAVMLLISSLCGRELALARDANLAERTTGDDDPVLIPAFMVPRSLAAAKLDVDPSTTGSVETPARETRRSCNVAAWFPARPFEQQRRSVC